MPAGSDLAGALLNFLNAFNQHDSKLLIIYQPVADSRQLRIGS
jgi:hypothetical protein